MGSGKNVGLQKLNHIDQPSVRKIEITHSFCLWEPTCPIALWPRLIPK